MNKNDHAQDRYDPPNVGSEFDEDRFSEINPGNIFRTVPNSQSRQFRKLNENEAIDVVKQELKKFDSSTKVYVKS